MLDEEHIPADQARLLFPVSTAEASAIEVLANYPTRLASMDPQFSPGYHESGDKKARLIEYNTPDPDTGVQFQPTNWRQVILKTVQFGVATPIYKPHDANTNAAFGRDLVTLDMDFIPDTEYVRVAGRTLEFLKKQDRWVDFAALDRLRCEPVAVERARQEACQFGIPADSPDELDAKIDELLMARAMRRSTTFPRVVWRRRMASNGERMLFAALLPPGPAHIDAVHTLAMPSGRLTALVSGFWASLPLDYFIRTLGRDDLRKASAWAMPSPQIVHPLAESLLLRVMRLNCLTSAYKKLWAENYNPTWAAEQWVVDWPNLKPLAPSAPTWNVATPLRTEFERRAALVEIDALVAVWLGMDVDALIAAYRGRFPVLQKYDAASWFDARGSKLASNARTFGQYQKKTSWSEFEAYQESPTDHPVPLGYEAPFYKADREAEYRQAHAKFTAQLESAGDQ
jgi:hypothetical protein